MAARVTQLCDAVAALLTAAFAGAGEGQLGAGFAAVSATNPPYDAEDVDRLLVYVLPASLAGEHSSRDTFDHRTEVDVVVLDRLAANGADAEEAAKRGFLESVERIRDMLEATAVPAADFTLDAVENEPLLDADLLALQPRLLLSIVTCTYLSRRSVGA